MSSWQGLAATLLLVGVVALAACFLLSIFFSRWTLRPVEHAWNQQKQFVADASHELKTPLTVILANTAILRSHPRDTIADQRQWVESTQVEALRMQDLVNDMLELARPDDDRASAETAFSVVDPSDLVENLALQFESVAFERNVELDCEVEGNVRVKGLEKRLERLVSTLLDNACKYARAGSSVRVTLSASEREATLRVVNDGSFIAEEDLPHVFDRFYRADKARSGDAGGFGLGLAIAREVAREHGGNITASSTPDEVTAFRVTIPLTTEG